MAVSDYNATPGLNTSISGINIAEGCAPGNLNDAIRQMMGDLKTFQATTLPAAYQPLDADLTSWAGVTRASGFDTFAATPSSANLRALLTDEVGTGAAYFVGGALGTPASGTLTNCTGLPFAGLAAAAVVTESEGIGSNDNDTTIPTSAAVKDYVDGAVAGWDFTSTQQSFSLSSKLTVAHGLSGIPTELAGYLICTTAQSPYILNEVLLMPTNTQVGASGYNIGLSADSTNIIARIGAQIVLNNDSGGLLNLTASSWRLVVRAKL